MNRAIRLARANPAAATIVAVLTAVAIVAGFTYARRSGRTVRMPDISIAMQGSVRAIGAVGRWHKEVTARIPGAPTISVELPLEIALARLLA